MKFLINSVNHQYNDEQLESTQIYYSASSTGDENGSITISGYIKLSAEEYEGNESPVALKSIIKQDIINKLNA